MSIQLSVQLLEGLPKNSDKCLFPPSLLQSTIDNVTDLPHPLVFNLSDGVSITAVGVKEFTAEEGTIEVPQYIFESIKNEVVSIELADLPKATFLQLKPAQFYPHITNWKYYLESQLSQNYTTLTKGKPFFIDDRVAKTLVEVNVEDANAPTVIVVDTDTILDVLPLNDIMAAQQLSQNDATSALENIPELCSSSLHSIKALCLRFSRLIYGKHRAVSLWSSSLKMKMKLTMWTYLWPLISLSSWITLHLKPCLRIRLWPIPIRLWR